MSKLGAAGFFLVTGEPAINSSIRIHSPCGYDDTLQVASAEGWIHDSLVVHTPQAYADVVLSVLKGK
jgi:hypothetical protein